MVRSSRARLVLAAVSAALLTAVACGPAPRPSAEAKVNVTACGFGALGSWSMTLDVTSTDAHDRSVDVVGRFYGDGTLLGTQQVTFPQFLAHETRQWSFQEPFGTNQIATISCEVQVSITPGTPGPEVPKSLPAWFWGAVGYLDVTAVAFVISLWALFGKARKPGWAALVPVYNTVVLCDVVGRPRWWAALTYVPVVNLVVVFTLCNDLAHSFGRDTDLAFGLFALPAVFYPILAFGPAHYVGPSAGSSGGPGSGRARLQPGTTWGPTPTWAPSSTYRPGGPDGRRW